MSGLGDLALSFEDRFKIQRYLTWLGEDVDMSSLETRISFQKTIYFLDILDVGVDYHFSWYLRGPYSTSLAADGFALDSMDVESRTELSADVDIRSATPKLEKAKQFLDEIHEDLKDMDKHSRLELAASLHFLFNFTLSRVGGFETTFKQLCYHKPRFKGNHALLAWQIMEKHGLV